MKRTKTIIADDGETRLEITVKMEKDANWDSKNVISDFNYRFDSIVEAVASKFHFQDIKIK